MQGMYNMRSPAVKRLMKEAQELREPTEQYYAQPLEDNLFEWHFTIRGPTDSEFDGGLYHGRIVLPPEYPMKPPSILILTPNGRFEVNRKICLSISGHHPESWQPSWSIRTALLAIIGFMPTHGAGAIGSLNYTKEERKILATRSNDFKCTECGHVTGVLQPVTEASEKTRKEAKELAAQMDFKDEKEKESAMKEVIEHGDTTEVGSGAKETWEKASEEPLTETPTETESQSSPTTASTTASTTATPAAVQQPSAASTNPMTPTSFGQLPFQNPFMSGFPAYQPATTNSATSGSQSPYVPRFPPPFLPAMFPPQMGNPAMIHGLRMPPWPQGNTFSRSPFGHMNQSPTNVGTTSTETIQPATTPGSSSTSNNPQEAAPTSQSSQSPVPNVSQAPPSSQSVQPRDSPPASGGSTPQPTQTTSPPASSSSNVRQRNVGSSGNVNVRTDQLNAEVNTTPARERESMAFLLFVGFVSLVIAILIIRRLYMIKLFNKVWF